jgi:hypothetical protein
MRVQPNESGKKKGGKKNAMGISFFLLYFGRTYDSVNEIICGWVHYGEKRSFLE